MKKIALFASGSGSNVQNIYEYFKDNNQIKVELVFCNNPNAGVLQRCKNLNLDHIIFDKKDLYENNNILNFYRPKDRYIAFY